MRAILILGVILMTAWHDDMRAMSAAIENAQRGAPNPRLADLLRQMRETPRSKYEARHIESASEPYYLVGGSGLADKWIAEQMGPNPPDDTAPRTNLRQVPYDRRVVPTSAWDWWEPRTGGTPRRLPPDAG